MANKKAPVWALFSSGGWIRTNDLRVMSPTSCLCSTPQRAHLAMRGALYINQWVASRVVLPRLSIVLYLRAKSEAVLFLGREGGSDGRSRCMRLFANTSGRPMSGSFFVHCLAKVAEALRLGPRWRHWRPRCLMATQSFAPSNCMV
jgi:hypothetical protein